MVDVRRSAVHMSHWRHFEHVATPSGRSAKCIWRLHRNQRFLRATSDTLLNTTYDFEFDLSGQLNLAITGLMLLIFMTIHLFQLRFADTEQYFLRHQPLLIGGQVDVLLDWWQELFLRAARHPADSDGRPTVSCPGTGHGTKCTMASVPLWGSTALQSAVSLWEMFTLLKRWARFCSNRLRRELPAFWTELLSCLVITCHNLWQAITGQHNLS